MRRVEKSWNEIDAVLCEHFHSSFLALRAAATSKQIQGLEKTLGQKLPADFKRSLGIHNGLNHSQNKYFVNGNRLLSTQAIVAEWKMRREVHTKMLGDDNRGGCSFLKDKRIRNDLWWRPGWIPVLEFNGDLLLLDCDPGRGGKVGQVIKFYNYGGSPRRVVAASWTEWLDRLAGAAAAREFTISDYGDLDVKDVDLT